VGLHFFPVCFGKFPLILVYFPPPPPVDFDVDVVWFHMFTSAHFVEPFCNICF